MAGLSTLSRRADSYVDGRSGFVYRHTSRLETASSLQRTVYLRGERIADTYPAARMGFIEAGVVAVVRIDRRGEEAIIEVRGAGETFGEEILTGHDLSGPNTRLEALVPTRVRWIDPAALNGARRLHIERAVMAIVATRIRQQHEYACRKRLQSLSQRVADTLLYVSRQTVLGTDASALHHITRFDLARVVGSNRTGVSKVCNDFERRGWCTIAGKSITGVHEEALKWHATKGLSSLGEHLHDRLLDHQTALLALATAPNNDPGEAWVAT